MDQEIPWESDSKNERIIEETHRDVPVSFSRERREYLWRIVRRASVQLSAPNTAQTRATPSPTKSDVLYAASETHSSGLPLGSSSALAGAVPTDHDPMDLL